MAGSIAEALEQAVEQHEEEEARGSGEENTEESVGAAGEEGGPTRDSQGRFAASAAEEPAGEEPAAVDPPEGTEPRAVEPTVEVPPEPTEEHHTAGPPVGWRPAAREKWKGLPQEVMDEVNRRELGIQQALTQTADDRKLAAGFKEVYAPYEAMIRSEGADPLQATTELFKTAAALRSAPPAHKAQLVAQMVQQFGIDIQMLDAALTQGPAPQQRAPQQQAPTDPNLQWVQQLKQGLEQHAQSMSQQQQQAGVDEVAAFAHGKEFFADVRDEMADIIEVKSRQGVELSLEDAYNQACRLNPEIAKIVGQRERAIAAGDAQQRNAGARRAASSVSGSPAGAPPATGNLSRRDAILAAMDQQVD